MWIKEPDPDSGDPKRPDPTGSGSATLNLKVPSGSIFIVWVEFWMFLLEPPRLLPPELPLLLLQTLPLLPQHPSSGVVSMDSEFPVRNRFLHSLQKSVCYRRIETIEAFCSVYSTVYCTLYRTAYSVHWTVHLPLPYSTGSFSLPFTWTYTITFLLLPCLPLRYRPLCYLPLPCLPLPYPTPSFSLLFTWTWLSYWTVRYSCSSSSSPPSTTPWRRSRAALSSPSRPP